MNILIAPNSLKNAANADEVSSAIKEGIQLAIPDASITEMPLADGGEYTLEIILKILGGNLVTVATEDPLGRPIKAIYGITEDQTAIIELPKASGNELLCDKEKNPLHTSTFGTGLQIKDALEKGCKDFIITLGGSATVDGGSGILQALGLLLLDKNAKPLPHGGGNLMILDTIDSSKVIPEALSSNFTILCDVKNPLLGANGAAMIFAPQKGAGPLETMVLERCLTNWGNKCETISGKKLISLPGAGAAGGVAVGLKTFFNTEIIPGTDYILDLLKADQHIDRADIIITAEGSLDSQTFEGKAPYVLAKKAKEKGKKIICIAGAVPHRANHADDFFDAVFSMQNKAMSMEESIDNTIINLKNTAFEIGRLLS